MPEHKKELSTTNQTTAPFQRPEPLDLSLVNSIDPNYEDQDAPPAAPRGVHQVSHFSNYNATEQAVPAAFQSVSGELAFGLGSYSHDCFSS